MDEPKYKRVLLKISGEALAGDQHAGLNFEVIGQVCDVIGEIPEQGLGARIHASMDGVVKSVDGAVVIGK